MVAPTAGGDAAPLARAGRYKFTAGGFDAWGVMLVNGLLVALTCGIAFILGVPSSRMQYWAITNTARDGQRLQYEAGIGEAIGAALVRALLLVATCGFALPWASAMSQRFRVEHTSTAEGHRMRFTGTGGDVLGLWLLAVVALPLSFGLAWPWLAVLRERWVAASTVVLDPSAPGGEYRLRFDAGPLSYFVQGVLSLLLSLVTLGLYSPFAIASYHAFVWSSMSDTLSPPVAVPSGPRTAGQWAVVAAAGMSVALLTGACLFLAVLPAAFGTHGLGASAGGAHDGWSDDAEYGEGGAEDFHAAQGGAEESRRAGLAAQAPCNLPCVAGSQCRGGSCVALQLAADDAAYTDRVGGRGWGDRCIGHMRAGALDHAEAACARGLAMATTSAVRGALLYNLALISERRGNRDAARDYYRRSLEARPGNAAVERALAAYGVGAGEPPVSGNATGLVDGDLDASALAWWRRGDTAARDRLVASGLSPALIRATASLNVRTGPSANERFVRTLPEGTIVVALRGTIGGIPSVPGRGNWSRVVASETLSGWIASGVTADYRGCTPEPDALVAQMVAVDQAARIRRDVLFSRIESASASPMFLLTAREPGTNASYVGLFGTDRSCRLERRHVVRLDGELEDALVTWTAQQGGEPLLGAGVRAFGAAGAPTTWRVWSVGVSEPVWQDTVPTAMDIPDGQRGGIVAPFLARRGPSQGWWPLRLRRANQALEYYVWTGSTLAVATTPGAQPTGAIRRCLDYEPECRRQGYQSCWEFPNYGVGAAAGCAGGEAIRDYVGIGFRSCCH